MSRINRNKRVVVAMSGGVDSSVTAGLLVEQGYDVQGVSLRLWEGEKGPRVCSDHRGAREIAEILGFPHTLLDLRSEEHTSELQSPMYLVCRLLLEKKKKKKKQKS